MSYKLLSLLPFLLLPLLFNSPASAGPLQTQKAPLRVAIIDTGLSGPFKGPLCPSGHKDFSNSGNLQDQFIDAHHGTLMSKIVTEAVGTNQGWCLIVLKVYNKTGFDFAGYLEALKYTQTLNVQVVNLSLEGTRYDLDEIVLIKKLLSMGVQIVAAAGNEFEPLDKQNCFRYPACADSRVLVVGAADGQYSNFGSAIDLLENGQYGPSYGTSIAAARVTGNIIKQALELRKLGY